MIRFLTYISLYIGSASLLLCFFLSSKYNEKPGLTEYTGTINKFYNQLILKLSENKIKVNKLFNRTNYLASFYRHNVCKKYLYSPSKMREIGFSNEDIMFYQENIIPIHEIRNILYIEMNLAIICFSLSIVFVLMPI